MWLPTKEVTMLNAGYAELDEQEGLFVDNVRSEFDRYRYQLYHFIVMNFGGVKSMENKTVLETGCGRGGGLNYLANTLKPQYAIGIDFSRTQVCSIILSDINLTNLQID